MFGSTSSDARRHAESANADYAQQSGMSEYGRAPESTYRSHAEYQLRCGEGSDLLSLTEPKRAATSLAQWPDLLSFDIAYWNDQQAEIIRLGHNHAPIVLQQHRPGFIASLPEGYLNQFRGEWIRLYYHNRFVYGNLYSAQHYIMFKALVAVAAWLNSRYPHQLQRDSQLLAHDRCSNEAFHRESHFGYESIKNYFISHCSDWISAHYFDLSCELNTQLNQQTPATFIIEYLNSHGLPCVDFVCKNQTALRMVRPANFVEDMQSMVTDAQYLQFKIQQMAAKIAREIRSVGW